MNATMLAGRMNFATGEFAVKEVPVPQAGPGEARVQVKAAGVCLSDVHLIARILTPLFLNGDEVTLGIPRHRVLVFGDPVRAREGLVA